MHHNQPITLIVGTLVYATVFVAGIIFEKFRKPITAKIRELVVDKGKENSHGESQELI